MCIFILFLLLLSFISRVRLGLNDIDDVTYRASAPLYWIQEKSVFYHFTYDERQQVFQLATGILYAWPLLFELGIEFTKIFYWSSLCFSCIGIFLISQKIHADTRRSLLGIILFIISYPITLYYSGSFFQESWLTIFVLAGTYHLLELSEEQKSRERSLLTLFLISISSFACLLAKPTGFTFILMSMVGILFFSSKKLILKNSFIYVFFTSILLIISGYISWLKFNYITWGGIFGSKALILDHTNFNIAKGFLYFTRIPFFLLDIPFFTISTQINSGVNVFNQKLSEWVYTFFSIPISETHDYRYETFFPMKGFGILGILILFILFYSLWNLKNVQNSKKLKVFLLFTGALIFSMTTIEWMLNASPFYRHLIPYMAGFSALVPHFLYVKVGRLKYIVSTVFIVYCITVGISSLKHQFSSDFSKTGAWNFEVNYQPIFSQIDKPSNFLVFGHFCSISDFYILGDRNHNKLFQTEGLSEVSTEKLNDVFNKHDIDYIVVSENLMTTTNINKLYSTGKIEQQLYCEPAENLSYWEKANRICIFKILKTTTSLEGPTVPNSIYTKPQLSKR